MDSAHKAADKTIEQLEKELQDIYKRAQKELAAKANAYMNKFIEQDEKKRKLVDKGKLSEKDYKEWLKKKVMSGQRFTKMKEQCAEQMTHANQIATDTINGRMPEVYSVAYNALKSDVKELKGYSFHIVSADTVKALAGKDDSFLPKYELDPAKDIPWNMKSINAEVLQGVLQGESVKDISKRVFGYTVNGETDIGEALRRQQIAANRTARTLVTAAENKGRQDSYDRATSDGVILQKQWYTTMDGHARDTHKKVNGEIVDENEKFPIVDLMYPGDPDGEPEEVYNCRCSMAAIVKGFVSKRTGEVVEKDYSGKRHEETEAEETAPAPKKETTKKAQPVERSSSENKKTSEYAMRNRYKNDFDDITMAKLDKMSVSELRKYAKKATIFMTNQGIGSPKTEAEALSRWNALGQYQSKTSLKKLIMSGKKWAKQYKGAK